MPKEPRITSPTYFDVGAWRTYASAALNAVLQAEISEDMPLDGALYPDTPDAECQQAVERIARFAGR